MPIPTGSGKFAKIRVEEKGKDEGFVGSMLPEEKEAGQELVLPENA